MADRRLLLPEVHKKGHRLGRHINHDPRSLRFTIGKTAAPTTVKWQREIPVLDQGNLGSCTGNATVGSLGTGPNYAALSDAQRKTLDEKEAVAIYSAATKLDDAPGSYPPDDTGSDGLSVAKAAQQAGYISGYQHVTSMGEMYAALLQGPVILGTSWHAGMDTPDAKGVVTPTGAVRGGHEYECIGYDASSDLFEMVNSWGEGWGVAGHFFYSSKSLSYLLGQQGDGTLFVPLSQPAPTPSPAPVNVLDSYPRQLVDMFAAHPRGWKIATEAANALLEFEKVAFPA